MPCFGYGFLRLCQKFFISCFLPPSEPCNFASIIPEKTLTTSPTSIKIAAIAGSLRKSSTHKGLVRAAIQIAEEHFSDVVIEALDIASLPFLNTDLEKAGTFPDEVKEFRAKVLEADAILFASPEYNYSLTGPLKNAIDWASQAPNVFADKTAAIVSAGEEFGGGRSQYHLRQVGVYLNLHFVNKPELFIRSFEAPPKFDGDGNLVDLATKEKLKELLIALRKLTMRFRCSYEI